MAQRPIKSLEMLHKLALEKRSVFLESKPEMPMPAAVVMNWQGHVLHGIFTKGSLFVYKKGER